MNRYDPIDRWIASRPRRTQLILSWLRVAIFVEALLVALRGCQGGTDVPNRKWVLNKLIFVLRVLLVLTVLYWVSTKVGP